MSGGADVTAEDVENQLRDIRSEISEAPLLSDSEPLSLTSKLAVEFQNDDAYYHQVLSLFSPDTAAGGEGTTTRVYNSIRYARRDGNCFYRCASFRLYEIMLTDRTFADECLRIVEATEKRMVELFGDYSADFCEVVREVITKIKTGVVATPEDVYAAVVASDVASYIIVFFRYAVSVYLRDHADDFLPFVMGLDFATVEGFCSKEVEPVDRESDNIHLVGFAKLFNVAFVVETLDRNVSGARTTHRINERTSDVKELADVAPRHTITLLFRPGHYDLLEK